MGVLSNKRQQGVVHRRVVGRVVGRRIVGPVVLVVVLAATSGGHDETGRDTQSQKPIHLCS